MNHPPDNLPLSPLPIRLAAWAVLVVIAFGSIWLIDARAMMRNEISPTVSQPSPTPN